MSTTYANIVAGTLAATPLEPTEPTDAAYLSIATALATTTLESPETATTSYITPATRSTDQAPSPPGPTKGKQSATLVVSGGSPIPTSGRTSATSRALPRVGKSGTTASRKTGGTSLAVGSGSGTGTITSAGSGAASGGTTGGAGGGGGGAGATTTQGRGPPRT